MSPPYVPTELTRAVAKWGAETSILVDQRDGLRLSRTTHGAGRLESTPSDRSDRTREVPNPFVRKKLITIVDSRKTDTTP